MERLPELFSERVRGGSRYYFFDIKQATNGDRYLVISESKPTEDGYEHNRVMIFEEYLEAFAAGFTHAVEFFRDGDSPKAYDVKQIRKEYPQAYERWTDEEEARLIENYQSGLSIPDLAEYFQRKPSAIRSRLRRLGME